MADEQHIEQPKTYDIEGVEIFAAGTWNGDKYTESDLDEIVSSFDEIGDKLKPYVKLGHSNKQALLQKDGLPAAGWITSVKRVGEKLVATFSNVPEKIYHLIQSKAYGRMSSEVFWNLREGGKTYRRALKAVALLGGDTPAVTNLDDFINLYTEIDYDALKLCTTMEDIMEIDVKKYEMEINELQTQLKNYELQLSDKDKQIAEANETIKSFEAEKVAAFSKEVESFLDDAAKAGKISPAQKEKLSALCGTPEAFENVKEFMAGQGEVVPMGEQSHHAEIDKGEKDPEEELDKRVKAYAKENNVSYGEAFTAIAYEDGGK